MDFKQNLNDAWRVATLDVSVMKKVSEASKDGMKPAFTVMALSALASALGGQIFPGTYGPGLGYHFSIGQLISGFIGSFLAMMLLYYFTAWVSTAVFKSKLSVEGLVKVLGHGSLVGVLSIFPPLAFLGLIWSLVIFWKVMSHLGKLEPLSIVGVLLFPLLVFCVLGFLFTTVLLSTFSFL